MQFIGGDPDKDVAVLQLQCPVEKQQELVPITVGTSANLLVGQKVFALGNPFGLDHSMTQACPSLPLAPGTQWRHTSSCALLPALCCACC